MNTIYIQKCEDFDEYSTMVAMLNIKSRYPLIAEKGVINRLNKSLEMEKIEFYIEDKGKINIDQVNFEDIVVQHNKTVTMHDNVIVAFKNQKKYIWVALHHAKLCDYRLELVKDFEEGFEYISEYKPKFVTFVSEHRYVEVKYITKLQQMQKNFSANSEEFFFSILTARNIESLISLVIRNDIFKCYNLKKFTHIIRLDHLNKEIKEEENLSIYPFSQALMANINKQLREQPNNLTTMIGHGRDDLFWLTDGGICGRKCDDEQHKYDEQHKLPACAYTDKCFKPNISLIPAYNIFTRHLFMNCCNGAKTEDCVFEHDYNMLFSFLDGHVVSYLGSSFNVDGKEFLNYYYMAQVLSGIPLGIAAGRVNKYYQDCRLGHEAAFYLIGDGTVVLTQSSNIFTIDLDQVNVDDKNNFEYRFELDEDSYLVRLIFSIEDLIRLIYSLRYRITVHSTSGQKLHGVFRRAGKQTILEIFCDGKIKKGEVLINIKSGIEFNLESVGNLQNVQILGVTPDNKFKPFLTETVQSGLKLARVSRNEINILNTVQNNLYSKFDKMHSRMVTLSEMLIKYLLTQAHNKGFAWDEHCTTNGLIYESSQELELADTCPNCNKSVYIMNYSHDLYKHLRRSYYCCPSCGIIKDSPIGKEDIEIYFEGQSVVQAGKILTQKLVIKNNLEKIIYGFGGMSVIWGEESNIQYDKLYDKVIILPNEKMEITINISFDKKTFPHNYWLRGNAILNGDILSVKRDIWVVP